MVSPQDPRLSVPRRPTPPSHFRQLLDAVALIVGVGLMVGYLTANIADAFYEGTWYGLRSLAASILPLLITIYIGWLVGLQVPINSSQAPKINNFIIFTLWTTLILGVSEYIAYLEFPLAEFLYSLTLAALILRYKRHSSFKALVACCYGIICGSLGALVLFG